MTKKLQTHAQDSPTEIESLTNQTAFFESELIEGTPPEYPVESDTRSAEEQQISIRRKKRLVLLVTSAITLISLLSAGIVFFSPEAQPRRAPVIPVAVRPATATPSAMLQRLRDLEVQVQAADPVVSQLPLPAVSFTLSLDPARR